MRILGIDCGTASTGWAVVEKGRSRETNRVAIVDFGVIHTSSDLSMPERLKIIYDELLVLIKKYSPKEMAVESVFFFKNQKTVISVGQARGVIILAGVNSNVEIFDYTPLQVKQAITGYGRADKVQVQKMIKAIFKLVSIPKPDDAADALAICLCHCNSRRLMIAPKIVNKKQPE